MKSVFNYLHIHKMATERCLRNLFSDLGMYTSSVDNFRMAHTDIGFSFKDADNVVQVNYATFVDEIKRSLGERPSTATPYGIKSGWSAERPRGKCQVPFILNMPSASSHIFCLQNIKELQHVKWMTAHRQAYDVGKGGPVLQYIVEGAYFNDHDEPKERPFNSMKEMVEGVGYLDFAEPFKKSPWHGKEHILRNLQHTARLSKKSALRRSQTPEPGVYNKMLSSQHASPIIATRSPSRLGNDALLQNNQNFGAGILSRTHRNPVVSPSPGLPTIAAVKRFGLQPDAYK